MREGKQGLERKRERKEKQGEGRRYEKDTWKRRTRNKLKQEFFFPEEGKQNSYRLAVKVILRRGE